MTMAAKDHGEPADKASILGREPASSKWQGDF